MGEPKYQVQKLICSRVYLHYKKRRYIFIAFNHYGFVRSIHFHFKAVLSLPSSSNHNAYWLLCYFGGGDGCLFYIFGHAYTLVIIKRTKNGAYHSHRLERKDAAYCCTDTTATLCALLLESWNRNFGGFQKRPLYYLISSLSLFIVCSPPPTSNRKVLLPWQWHAPASK